MSQRKRTVEVPIHGSPETSGAGKVKSRSRRATIDLSRKLDKRGISSHGDLSTLDFMRALSTVVVVGIHYLGMTGRVPHAMGALPRVVVLMFFVHTSFVLMLSLERQQIKSPEKLWRRFMLRRFFRVYPLPILVLAAIILFRIPSQMVPPSFQYLRLGTTGIISNFLLTMNLTRSDSILSPMWSLPYEFQLYFVLPALFLLVQRWRSPAPVFGLWCVALALALVQPVIPRVGRLDILEFVPCFVAGILCYKLSKTVKPMLPFVLWPILIPAFMFICLLSSNPNHWPAAWLACLLTALTAPFIRQAHNGVVRNVSHWLAQHSFGIYLSHYFCLWLAFRVNHFPWLAQWTIFVATMLLLPVALYRLIESPMISLGNRNWTNKPPIAKCAG
jgi:peptidoglycan/LPS O-acetylase OafA/YrhL